MSLTENHDVVTKVTVYQVITDCGDGSATTQVYLTYPDAVAAEEQELREWGVGLLSDNPEAIETYVGSNIYMDAVAQ